jgi:hypothetical protein
LPGRIHLVAGLDDIAHYHTLDRRGIKARPAQSFPHDYRAKVGGRNGLK